MENELIEIKYYNEAKDKFAGTSYLGIQVEHFANIQHKGLDRIEILSNQSEISLKHCVDIKLKELECEWQILEHNQIDTLLINGLNIPCQIDWKDFKELRTFKEPNPETKLRNELDQIKEPIKPELLDFPRKQEVAIPTRLNLEELPIKPHILFLPINPSKKNFLTYLQEYIDIFKNSEQISSSQITLAWKLINEISHLQNYDEILTDISRTDKNGVFFSGAEKRYDSACKKWNPNELRIKDYNETCVLNWKKQCADIEFKNHQINLKYLRELEAHSKQTEKDDAEYLRGLEEHFNRFDLDNTQYQTDIENYKNRRNFKLQEIDSCVKEWEIRRSQFQLCKETYKEQIDDLKRRYSNFDLNAVAEYSKLVLEYSKYPEFVLKKFEVDYNQETKILVIEYALPPIDTLPTLKEVKWIKHDLKKYYISETQLQKDFEKTMYSITLRSIYELFHTDEINALDAICFNGWVSSLNKATGKRENNCILSIQAKKVEFNEIDLSLVDPKICFKSFKGVSSSKLSAITSIQPIIQIDRKDKRFVESQNITHNIDESTNLAAMDWEEFEHLIREVFEKEFSYNGGEVKVTQASRDGGVDAIAFDPDPIRGGKIVIQAKRYTNTVGVSAVRDLFGTVMNEGANKGILVTTSDYGPDSYEFAKGKPITLLNGSNLLYLLEKHGHNARIDIEEARRLMKG